MHPLVETLADAGYLMRDESSRLIRLGPILTGIGAAALGHRAHMVDSLRPAMEELAHDSEVQDWPDRAQPRWTARRSS